MEEHKDMPFGVLSGERPYQIPPPVVNPEKLTGPPRFRLDWEDYAKGPKGYSL
jgi:hypothetical protein